MKSLVVGMGIGQLYKDILVQNGHEVVTVDQDIKRRADLPNVESAILSHAPFDTVHICTPNFTHEALAHQLAPHARIVFIEKPGVLNSDAWTNLVTTHSRTRFIMVKNNQWRTNIDEFKDLAKKSAGVCINWVNWDRVPKPGSWFTNKELAYGGVSRDLMPHLLSWFMALEPNYEKAEQTKKFFTQNWQLSDVTNSDYGTVNPDGVYNVDDECIFEFKSNDKWWVLNANWRSLTMNTINLTFVDHDDNKTEIELGLCPEEAYLNMIQDCIKNIDNPDFWKLQYKQDTWIHDKIKL